MMLIKIRSLIEIESFCFVDKKGFLVDKANPDVRFLPYMRKYCGEKTEVLKETKRGIYLKIDASESLWLSHWLEKV
jgi:hypothetical protein